MPAADLLLVGELIPKAYLSCSTKFLKFHRAESYRETRLSVYHAMKYSQLLLRPTCLPSRALWRLHCPLRKKNSPCGVTLIHSKRALAIFRQPWMIRHWMIARSPGYAFAHLPRCDISVRTRQPHYASGYSPSASVLLVLLSRHRSPTYCYPRVQVNLIRS